MVKKMAVNRKLRIKGGVGSLCFDIINYTILALIMLATIYPLYYIVVLSFNDGVDALQGGIFLLPRKFTFNNYIEAFSNEILLNSFMISIARTLIGTLTSVFFIALMAYGLSDKKLVGRRFLTKYFFFTTLFGGGAIPFLILIRDLDLLDNFLVYILPAVYGFMNMLIVRIAFESIPIGIQESAKIDGANEWQIFSRIYLPLAVPALVTVGLFTAVFHWNDWFAGAYYVNSDTLKPAATILQEMLIASMSSLSNEAINSGTGAGGGTSTQTLQMAFVVIILLPILLVYPFAQKYFVKGAIVGSIKE